MKSHHLFIIIALPFIFILFFLKWDTNHLELNSSIELPRHILIKTKEHSFSLTSRPISNHQFHTFVEHTGFKSWRELHDVFPNWEKESYYSLSKNWEVKASDPVLWLTQKDALQFCLWMAVFCQIRHKHAFFFFFRTVNFNRSSLAVFWLNFFSTLTESVFRFVHHLLTRSLKRFTGLKYIIL